MFENVKVGEFMTRPVVTVFPNTPIGEAHRIMIDKAIRRLPVTERGGIYNVDPKLKDPANGDLNATQAPANVGAHALPNTQASN